ncbi:50S ribosomal protein L29 [Porticoccaceae bacterium]|jgi:large subunit ribosomal protein L29|nr:50S ribosomal protein L29 [Porticoccaceae bacterium]MDA8664144.1 50S ribosomal protein L29 [Porticoccaceae bacterium]MDA8681865.1 50S ribosomal protein L29 [Porticoccaceae bacterium]MDB2634773.1 50S ribosomal protein L29 [Porticoccaceae bacterium]MDB2663714.1 50S ribosomal protein L29 [Porticoccaceae bacterium]
MKASELREKSVDELQVALNEELKQQFKLRMQLATGQLNESHLVKATRKNIARIKTAINEKAGDE